MPHGAYQTVIEGPLKRLRQAGRKFEIDPGLTEALLEDIEKGKQSFESFLPEFKERMATAGYLSWTSPIRTGP
jgi:hypothetical protein